MIKDTLKLLILFTGIIFISCANNKQDKISEPDKVNGYSFGEEKTFYSDKPVSYPIFFSDASWYPKLETWESEGVFYQIQKLTNVKLDLISFDSSIYNDSVMEALRKDQAAYIIPKIYSEGSFISTGKIVAISDYTKYMPNFNAFVKKYNMEADLDTIRQSDGKFYRLPGLLQSPLQDYTLEVRQDIFEAAGFDIRELEKNWTWETLHDILVVIKKYMVANKMCKSEDYIWSDVWCGQSGKGSGGNLLKLIGSSYGVLSGWAIEGTYGGIWFNEKTKEFYSTSISDDYKKFVKVANSFIKDGLLDPATFSQSDDVANELFYSGKTVIKSTNRSYIYLDGDNLIKKLGKDNFKLYVTVSPSGKNNYLSEINRLECGLMISQKAVNELGKEDFIKMLRFVDWMFYSEEAYSLVKWGPEHVTWHYEEEKGEKVKKLLPGLKNDSLGFLGNEGDVDTRLKWGYACGNYFYGHSVADITDNFTPNLRNLYVRFGKYKSTAKVAPAARPTDDQREQLNAWADRLTININKWTLNFVLGEKDIDRDWDAYLESCKNLYVDDIVNLINKIYKEQNKK